MQWQRGKAPPPGQGFDVECGRSNQLILACRADDGTLKAHPHEYSTGLAPTRAPLDLAAWAGGEGCPLAAPPAPEGLWQRVRSGWARLRRRAALLRHRTTHGSQEELAPSPSSPHHLAGDGLATQRARAVRRWQWAIRAVVTSRAMAQDADVLNDRLAPAADRLHALVDLEWRLSAFPSSSRRQLAGALLRRREQRPTSLKDHLLNECFVTGERIFQFFTPPEAGRHGMYFTALLLVLLVAAFWVMAGQYPGFKALEQPASLACLQEQLGNGTLPFGPAQLSRWMSPNTADWCFGGKVGAFNAEFLILWGARWGPAMRKAPQRWLTSALVHQNFMHLLSNCLLFAGLASQMERKYGTWRIALLFLLSAIGGNLFSAVFENACIAVVGASGGIFGIFGLFVADMVLNFETLTRPLMRSVIVLAFFIFFITTIATTPSGTSHLSHVGGFVVGLFAAFFCLPNFHRERWEAWLPALGGLVAVAVFVALPTYFYVAQFPSISC